MNEWPQRPEPAPTATTPAQPPIDPPPADLLPVKTPGPEPVPDQRLDRRAIGIWRIGEAMGWGMFLVFTLPGLWALDRFTDLPRWIVVLVGLVFVALAVGNVVFVPTLRWRSWRYRVGEVEVDLERGYWTIVRTRIPMARIQHVDTTRSPLQRRYGLASVVLYTAAGANEIPALADAVAESVRFRIAALANTRDDV